MADEVATTDPGRPMLRRMPGREAPPGPWWDEPDRVEWTHRGVACLALRGPMGAWCGYAGIPKGHPLHGVDYSQLEASVDVHGGLTFAGTHRGSDLWWLGFDCSHAGDFAPGLFAVLSGATAYPGEVYRDLAYARLEVEGLARWVADHGWPDTEDPNALCMCGHVLISHRPPLFSCLAYNRTGDEGWHGCPCEVFIEERTP